MESGSQAIICGNCSFYNHFDSANLARVEQVKVAEKAVNEIRDSDPKFFSNSNNTDNDKPDYEFNVWTKHDCHGTEYQNNNRTWFYFGVKPNTPGVCIKFNVVNLNRQSKMFSQGMCPVFKIIPGHPHWERIRDKPTYAMDQKGSEFTLSFVYRTPDNPKAISYLAFTYPFTYQDLQNYLVKTDNKMAKRILLHPDDIYYHRECAIKSLEGRRLDLLTISSFHNITTEREDRLKGMFPDLQEERPFKFHGKKVVFLSARVHPGETPSSFVFNGFLNFLLNRDDPIAGILRRIYVFKLVPMLNPDGVARGHYRMDTRGVNLNRVYLEPSITDHPTIFAARSLIKYYHNYYTVVDDPPSSESPKDAVITNEEPTKEALTNAGPADSSTNVIKDTTNKLLQQVTLMTLDESNKHQKDSHPPPETPEQASSDTVLQRVEENHVLDNEQANNKQKNCSESVEKRNSDDSGLFLYIDLHGHASKKGVFMYGNYFDDPEDTIMCMLLPKLMSINNPNFHFTSCSFAERNMYLIDRRDGMSREGSGRVAVYKLTGLVRSYTLECNYNSGRLVNTLPQRVRDGSNKTPNHMYAPPKYTPTVFEEVGAALGPSILDLTNSNPNSRLPNSQYRSLRGVKSFLKLTCINNHSASIGRTRHKGPSVAPTKEAPRLADIVSSMNRVLEAENVETAGNHVVKPRIVRRTTSLYAAVKRIKSSKKTRQANRAKSLKGSNNQRTSDNGGGPGAAIIAGSIGSSHHGTTATVLRPVADRQHRLAVENTARSESIVNQQGVVRCGGKKTSIKSTIEVTSSEITTAVKQGSKRLKIVSPRIVKTKPEVGESSKTSGEDILASSSAVIRFRNKQTAKGTFGRCRKPSLKGEAKAKTRKTKLKAKG